MIQFQCRPLYSILTSLYWQVEAQLSQTGQKPATDTLEEQTTGLEGY